MPDQIQITAVKPRVQYVADGVRREFLFPFAIIDQSNLEVYVADELQTTGFEIRGAGKTDGGSVVFDTAPASGLTVSLRRQMVMQRTTDFQESGPFRAKAINAELDNITSALQQLDADLARSIHLSPTDLDANLLLPDAASRAGKAIVFDAKGDLTTAALASSGDGKWSSLDDVPEGVANKHFTAAERAKLSGVEDGAQANPVTVTAAEKADPQETAPRSFSPKDMGEMIAQHAPAADAPVKSVHGRIGEVTAQPGDYAADQISDTAEKVVMTAAERAKLSGVEDGAQANPVTVTAAEKADPQETAPRSFSPKDMGEMIAQHAPAADAPVKSVHGRIGEVTAQPGDYAADQISDTAEKVVMTAAERAKLASVAQGAEVNTVTSVHGRTGAIAAKAGDYTADLIADGSSKVVMTSAERATLNTVEPGAQKNTVSSVHGRAGVITAQAGDYTADQIADGTAKVSMTIDERVKLTGIQLGAQANPTQVTATEKAAGTGTTVRSFAPVDVRDIAATIVPAAPVSSVAGKTGAVSLANSDVGLGNVSNDAQLKADLAYTAKTSPVSGDKLVIKDQTDGKPKVVDWSQLPTAGGSFSLATLTSETVFDNDSDFLLFRDTSAGADRKIKPKSIGFPNVLSDPYQDRLLTIAANNTDISAALRAAVAAAVDGGTIKLEGMGRLSRDGTNGWGLLLPAKNLTIVGSGRGFHLKHADPASDTDAFTMLEGAMNGKSLHIENLVLEGIWARQAVKQEVAGARFVHVTTVRELRMFGIKVYDGVEMGLTAQDCGVIRVDRCHVERNTRDCINVNGRDIAITNCSAFYSRDDCFAIYVPSSTPDDENYIHVAAITDNTAKWTNGIKAAAPRLTIARNRLDAMFLYGIRTFTDEAAEGEVVPQELSIIDNHIFNVISNDQCFDANVINRAISVDSYTRPTRKLTIEGNRVAATFGPLWTGSTYASPSSLKRGVAIADDSLGMFRKSGFVDAWEDVKTAGKEPIHQRISGISVVTQAPIGNSEVVIRNNPLRDMRQTETRQIAFVAYKSDSGVDWIVPAIETAWKQITPLEHFLRSSDFDFTLQKVRLEVTVGGATIEGAVLKAQYAFSAAGPWYDLCSVTLDSGTNKTFYPVYANIPVAVLQTSVYVRIAGQKGNGTGPVTVKSVVLRFCRDGDAPHATIDPLPLARIPEGAGDPPARPVTAAEVAVADRFLVLRPGVKRVVLPRTSSLIRTTLLQNRSGGAVTVLANEGKVASGAKFDAASYMEFPRTGLSTLPASFQKFTVSLWASFDTFDQWNFLLSCFQSGKGAFDLLSFGSPATLQVLGKSANGTVVLDYRTVTTALATGTLYHILIACDLTVPVIKIRLNGQSVAQLSAGYYTPVLTAGGLIDLNSTIVRVGARSSATTPALSGSCAQLWFAPGVYLDLDNQGNVDKFFANGAAVNLGYNGSRPTGVPPTLFLNGQGAAFGINQANPTEVATIGGTLTAPQLAVPGQEIAYTIDGDGPTFSLADGKSASFTTIDDPVEVSQYVRLGGV
ncbi:MAG: hypothetical protein IPK66_02995 [Rhodospirillales bacterium]|nr:hypothetical protein [Rhodospirillales bacterium]